MPNKPHSIITNLKLTFIIAFIFACINLYSQNNKLRIGFFGNSITMGRYLPNEKTQNYPAQLANMLTNVYGDTIVVENFAVSGRTMLKKGDYPLWNETLFADGLAFAPNICFIMLGTNDTKPQNWDSYGRNFYDDYLSMINTFKMRNPRTKFIVAYPLPVLKPFYGIRNEIVVNGIIPAIDSILKVTNAILMDFYHPFIDSIALYHDDVHPNLAGAKYMAELVYARILETDIVHKVETGYPFVRSFISNKSRTPANDSVTLSWSTINAEYVKFEGRILPANGSIKVTNSENTSYSLVALNDRGADTLVIEQEFYTQIVSKISVAPFMAKSNTGDSLFFQIKYYDQYNKLIEGDATEATWEIIDGIGTLYDIKSSSVILLCTSEGDVTLKATIGKISATAKIKVSPKTAIKQETLLKGVTIFPNPMGETINISCVNLIGASLKFRIYSISGEIVLEKDYKLNEITDHMISINTKNLSEGNYIVELEANNRRFSQKITK